MTKKTPALDQVSVRVVDNNGQTKAFFPTVENFINYVTRSDEQGWYSRNDPKPSPQPWYRKWIQQ